MMKDDCIFCKIARGEIPSATIYEDEAIKAFLDVSPAGKGHALIITKEHYDNIFQLDKETAGKVFGFATDLARAIKEDRKCPGMNIVQNNGEVAGQTVNHFHLHLIPRFPEDDVKVTWKQHSTVPEEQIALAEAIRRGL